MILQPGEGAIDGTHYLATRPDTALWGVLPCRETAPVLAVQSGDVVTIDSLSHEGILEEFGRDPEAWFGGHGVAAAEVLRDAIEVASSLPRPPGAGPHVVTGPIAVRDARPGDVVKVTTLGLRLRVGYGVISNRHGFGALAGEYPRAEGTFSVFTRVEGGEGVLPFGDGRAARFPIAPFLGVIGVATDTDAPVSSVPPGGHGGNLDVKPLVVGSALYLPVQVPDAGLYVGDPHFAQGDGEVCLTALEGSLRADLRIDLIRAEDVGAVLGTLRAPFGETDEHWIVIGLDEDLDEAVRDAARKAIEFLSTTQGIDPSLAYAYLSAAADFHVSQVVDGIKGVHCLIRKRDW